MYGNKFLILDQNILIKICGKMNDDKREKNPFLRMSTEKMQRRWTEECVAAG